MSQRLLVLHASDSVDEAKTFCKSLSSLGFTKVVSLSEVSSEQSSDQAYDLLRDTILNHDVVICLVSPGLFASCVLTFGVGLAMGHNKIISAKSTKNATVVPSWYDNFFSHNYSAQDLLQKIKAGK